jgi:alkylated DNA repair dioxygenase AlkB
MNISLVNGQLLYLPRLIGEAAAFSYFQQLKQLAWRQDSLQLYGKTVPIPRLQAWYGDSHLQYQYSGLSLQALPWTSELLALKQVVEQHSGTAFNSVLANFYRDGQDSVAWHSDDEPELGANPVVASLSFGGERLFKLKHKTTAEVYNIVLKSGDLLLMLAETQHYWRHCLPRSKTNTAARINLTFRKIID